jgi:uncharacterized protein YigE (DUF2233 family)
MIAIIWRIFNSPPAHSVGDSAIATEAGSGQVAQRCFRVAHGPSRATVCRVDLSTDRLQLFLQDEHAHVFGGFAALDAWLAQRGRKLVFAMNAGMFNPDNLPTGLFIADTGWSWPLNTADGEGNFFLKPNGVLVVSDVGARIVETSEYAALRVPVTLATQSGPLLVRAGAMHPAFRPDSTSRLIRNGVGVPVPGLALFAISDTPMNFYEFASLFRDTLHCPDALYLDGTVSSLHAPELDRSDRHVKLGPIVGVTIETAR